MYRFSLFVLCLFSVAFPCIAAIPKTAKLVPPTIPKPSPLIVLDPGHGGEDYGTYSEKPNRYYEKNLTLTTAKLVNEYLRELGYKTVLTRSDDTFISLNARAELPTIRHAQLFVSLHFNSAPSKEAEGIEIYFYKSSDDRKRTTHSKLLAQAVLNRVIANTEAKSRGVKHGNFAVIRNSTVPAVLVEGGFLTNDKERQKIVNTAYLRRLAWGVAQGINDYLIQAGLLVK